VITWQVLSPSDDSDLRAVGLEKKFAVTFRLAGWALDHKVGRERP
jgi:hypothetical protein